MLPGPTAIPTTPLLRAKAVLDDGLAERGNTAAIKLRVGLDDIQAIKAAPRDAGRGVLHREAAADGRAGTGLNAVRTVSVGDAIIHFHVVAEVNTDVAFGEDDAFANLAAAVKRDPVATIGGHAQQLDGSAAAVGAVDAVLAPTDDTAVQNVRAGGGIHQDAA